MFLHELFKLESRLHSCSNWGFEEARCRSVVILVDSCPADSFTETCGLCGVSARVGKTPTAMACTIFSSIQYHLPTTSGCISLSTTRSLCRRRSVLHPDSTRPTDPNREDRPALLCRISGQSVRQGRRLCEPLAGLCHDARQLLAHCSEVYEFWRHQALQLGASSHDA